LVPIAASFFAGNVTPGNGQPDALFHDALFAEYEALFS
jgi:hypothetical protein